jgi:non-specific serine/threonine protein kinase
LRRLRLAAGLSQESLAEQAHLSGDAIAALERGRTSAPRAETIGLIARALKLSPTERNQLAAAAVPIRRSPAVVSAVREPATRARRPNPTPRTAVPHNLPTPLSSFVGRAADLDRLCRVLGTPDGASRLVTLIGPGGIGKTRLAIEVARHLLEAFPTPETSVGALFSDGVWLVDLSALDDPSLVPAAVAAVLEVRDSQGQPVATRLAEIVSQRRLLIVLDNCEHLIDACARLAEMLLTSCPGLRLLATSRERLAIPGEFVWQVSPLSVRNAAAYSEQSSEAARGEAERLFLERAVLAKPTLALTEVSDGTIATICRQLDGIPLAIELAAARVDALDLQSIAERLSDRYRFLTTGNRAGLPRHQTLEALVEWSYDLLAPEEQLLFARLAVFPGGWTIEAAEAVCSEGLSDVVDLLLRLVAKSLVIQVEGKASRTRYRMLDTLRSYAERRLGLSGAAEPLRERHARHYLAFLESLDRRVEGPEQALYLDLLEEDVDNLRVALDWCTATDQAEPGLRGAWTLAILAWLRGYLNEIDTRLKALLAAPSAKVAAAAARAKGLVAAGYVAHYRGEVARARGLVEAGLDLFRRLDDRNGIGQALTWLGLIVTAQGEYELAGSFFQEALGIFEAAGDDFWTARVATNFGRCLNLAGKRAEAAVYLDRALMLRRKIKDARGVANTLFHLADGMLAAGDYDRAQALAGEAIAVARSIGDRFVLLRALIGLGRLGYMRGDLSLAHRYLDEALDQAQRDGFGHDQTEVAVLFGLIARDEGDLAQARWWANDGLRRAKAGTQTPEVARALYLLGDISRREGIAGEADRYLRDSLLIYRQIRNAVGIALALAARASLRAPESRTVRVVGAAEAVQSGQVGANASIEWRELGQVIDRARPLRDDPAVARAWEAGRGAAFDAVVAEALAEDPL